MNNMRTSKISTIAPGAFKTRAHTDNNEIFPASPAYSKEGLPSQYLRQWFKEPTGRNDPQAAAKLIFKFAGLDSPPVRWAIGKDSIAGARGKATRIVEEVDKFENWSEDL